MHSILKHADTRNTKSTVLIVDDQATSRIILENIAKTIDSNIEVKCYDNAIDALVFAESNPPDLILTDYKMPEMDGVEFIERLRDNIDCRNIPIVIITALDDKRALYLALDAGATDFLVKPVDHHECKVRCRNLLIMQKQQLIIKNHASSLEVKVKEAINQIHLREQETLSRLARAGEFKGKISGRNLKRMGIIARLIGEEMNLDKNQLAILEISSTMHDIGKIGIPDSILLKEGPLEEEEFTIMKEHSRMGYEILKDSPSPYLQMGAVIALNHHEKFDGSGYPNGLKGEEIPIVSRISTIADVFDALITKRPYKLAWPAEKAYDYIRENSGMHFDPLCVEAFFKQLNEIEETMNNMQDGF